MEYQDQVEKVSVQEDQVEKLCVQDQHVQLLHAPAAEPSILKKQLQVEKLPPLQGKARGRSTQGLSARPNLNPQTRQDKGDHPLKPGVRPSVGQNL